MKSNTKEMTLHVEQWSTSGQTKSAYCKEHEISYHRFLYYWRKHTMPQEVSSFTLLKPTKSKQNRNVELHLPNGCYFSIPEDCPMQLLQKLVSLC